MEALASACRKLVDNIDYDYSSKLEKQRHRESMELQEIMQDPKKRRQFLGAEGGPVGQKMNRFDRGSRRSSRRW